MTQKYHQKGETGATIERKKCRAEQAKRKAMEIAKKAEQKATLEAQARIDAEAENAKLKAILEQYQQKFDQVT